MESSRGTILPRLLAAAVALATVPVLAQDTDTFQVRVTVTESCSFSTSTAATDVDFGTVPRSTDPADATGSLVVDCTPGTPFEIGLNNGLNPATGATARATATNRRMTDGEGNYIPYGLWYDAGHTNPWGVAELGQAYSGTGTGEGQTIPIYGKVPAAATNVPQGTYSDTVTATLTF